MKSPTLGLALPIALIMFPQIVETIYSPALPNIATGFGIDAGQAALTLSLYFFAFAVGVVFWGRLCDTAGRRPTILAGLLLYGVASLIALFSTSFVVLLSARMLAAFGAAVGSIGTQTVIRDRYEGDRLARVFSVMGVAMAISPALGMLAGALLTGYWGYRGVFAGLAALAVLLLVWSAIKLPETRPTNVKTASLTATAIAMLYDSGIWRTALLIAIFNVCLFSYYQLAPFRFEQLGLSSAAFGYSGLLLAMGVGIGSWLNKNLLQRGWASTRIITFAAGLALFGGLLVAALAHVWVFVFPVALVVIAYGLAIPNILAGALVRYSDRVGTAGALLGMLYYIMLALGLLLAGWSQRLDTVLICCGVLALALCVRTGKHGIAKV